MIELKDLLGRVGDLILSGERERNAVIDVVAKVVGIKVEKEKIKIKGGVVYLDVKPIYKNEILLKREEIISGLRELLGERSPQDIR